MSNGFLKDYFVGLAQYGRNCLLYSYRGTTVLREAHDLQYKQVTKMHQTNPDKSSLYSPGNETDGIHGKNKDFILSVIISS